MPDKILLENGDDLLLESGDFLLKDFPNAPGGFQYLECGLVKWHGFQPLERGPSTFPSKIAAGGGGFTVDAVTFDGTNDWLTRGGGFTSASDSRQFLMSFWIKTTASAFTTFVASDFSFGGPSIIMNGSGTITAAMFNSGGSGANLTSLTSINDGSWHHVAISCDVNFADGAKLLKCAIDGVDDTPTTMDGFAAYDIDFTASEWIIGDDQFAGTKLNGDIAEFYMAFGQYLDITVAGNNQKFRTVAGKPENIGADGSTPTGTAPTLYLHIDDGETANNFATNAGSGGGMTVNGALATASTSPSD